MVNWFTNNTSRPPGVGSDGIIAALDIGTSKICCMIARSNSRAMRGRVLANRHYTTELLACYYNSSDGVRAGVVSNIERAEAVIRKVVSKAELDADCVLDSLIVNISAGRPKSKKTSSFTHIAGNGVNDNDISRLLTISCDQILLDGRSVLHVKPLSFFIDGNTTMSAPIGMAGQQIGINNHVVTCDTLAMDNLELCVNRCHLDVGAMVASAYASGLAVMVDDEMTIGSICIDMGGGTTAAAAFTDGSFVHIEAIAIGGFNITLDIARAFSISLSEAERIKTLYGNALPDAASATFGDEIITAPAQSGNSDSCDQVRISRLELSRVINARLEEIFTLMREKLVAAGVSATCGRRIVLTGGGSQMIACDELARRIIGGGVRKGRPLGLSGLPNMFKGPEFATIGGLLVYPQFGEDYSRSRQSMKQVVNGGYINRMGRWLRENF